MTNSDAKCIMILSNLAKAMDADSRVLICDIFISQRLGEADLASAVLDNAVISMGWKERTGDGFRKILDAAGLELIQIWRAPAVPGGCVETKLRG